MELKRQFGPWTAVSLIVGSVIGVGIFLVPAGMSRAVQSPAWLLAFWLLAGAMTVCGALAYAEMASRFPHAGGAYVYLRESYGRGAAFLYGWMVLLVLDPGLTAVFSIGFANYSEAIVSTSPAVKQLIAISLVVIGGAISILGARLNAGFVTVLTAAKIGTLLVIILAGFLSGRGNAANLDPFFAAPPNLLDALAGGLVGAFFAFGGWWEVTRITGEVREPERNIPRALLLGVLIVFIVYVLTSFVFSYLVPAASITDDGAFAALAGKALFGEIGGGIFAGVVMLSVFGTLFAYMFAAPRVYFAMARDGLFFRSVGELHQRFGTPHRATLIQMGLAVLLILSGTFGQVLSYFYFMVLAFTALTVLGLFRFSRAAVAGQYRTPFFPVTPILYVLITVVTLVFIAMKSPIETAIGVGVAGLGVPVYYLFFKRSATSSSATE